MASGNPTGLIFTADGSIYRNNGTQVYSPPKGQTVSPSPSFLNWDFSIGGVALNRFEVPEKFIVGYEMELKVHKYYSEDGTPSQHVNVMGAFSLPTTWEGVFFGGDALSRSDKLASLLLAGNALTWQYGPYSYSVYLRKYAAEVHFQTEVHYTLELEIQDEHNGLQSTSVSSTVAFDAATQSFYDNGNSSMQKLQKTATLPASLTSAYADSVTANLATSPIKNATIQQIQALIGKFQVLTAEISAYAKPLENAAVLEKDLAALNASLIALQGFGLYTTNLLQLLGNSPQAQIISGFTGSVAQLAAQMYPGTDIANATELIANANNLADYFVDIPQNITLPPVFS